LTDANKRAIYDKYGEEGLSDNFNVGGSGFDIFENLFGGARESKPRKTRSMLITVDIKLSEVYTGKNVIKKVTRKRICKECKG